MPIEFNNTYLNNGEFFDELYKQLQNPNVMRAFYDDLMKRDISKFRLSVDRVETTLMQDMKFMNADPIEQFIDYWGAHLKNHMEVKMQSSDLYQKFRHFWEVEEGKKLIDIPSQTKFSIRLKQFTARVRFFKQSSIYFELIN
jgi:predicted transposase YbfD/YdcC